MTNTYPESIHPPLRVVTSYPQDQLLVSGWTTTDAATSHHIQSNYVERFWLPILGPTTTLLIRRLATELAATNNEFVLDCAEWAASLGLGSKRGRNSPFWRSLERGARFQLLQLEHGRLLVRTLVPELSAAQIERLPQNLQIEISKRSPVG